MLLLPAAAVVYGLAQLDPLMGLLGSPATGVGPQAVATISGWLLIGVASALIAVRRADTLVPRAILAGDPRLRETAKAQKQQRRLAPEPDVFRLSGAKASLWRGLIHRRRVGVQMLIVQAVLIAIIVVLSRTASAWAPVVPMVGLAINLGVVGAIRPGPAGTDGRLLPVPARELALWGLLLRVTGSLQFVGPLLLALLLTGGGEPRVRTALLVCALPYMLLVDAIDMLKRRSKESPEERRRRLWVVLGVVLAVTALLLLPDASIAYVLMAATWLLVAAAASFVLGVRAIERI